jgi:hypothetical protein
MSGRARAVSVAAFLLVAVGLPARSEASLIGAGPSNLAVVETITRQGLHWLYTYSITSADPSNVWHFLIYTSFVTTDATSTFPDTAPGSDSMTSGPYSATSIDPTLVNFTNAWYSSFGGPYGLGTGGTATFSFVSSVFNASAKLYAYETAASGYAGGASGPAGRRGMVAAVGRTQSVPETRSVPEPSSALLLMGGLVGLAALRRRVSRTR